MKSSLLKLLIASLLALTALFWTACSDNDAEDAADEVGDAVEEAADDAGDAMEDAADEFEDATN